MEEQQRAPAKLKAILDRTCTISFPMASELRVGGLLRTLAATRPGGRFLEIGTGTGIATAWLLDGMDTAAKLTTVDVDAAAQAIAREHLADDPRVEIVTDDATPFLARQPICSFDLIFADAMIGKYEMLDETLALLRPGGLYVIDDMLPQTNWPQGHEAKVARLLATLRERVDLRATFLAWASGIVVAAKVV
jgi:predicted O-methyltransferase YrrM